MAPPRATMSMDSSPKSAKRRVSGAISPEYSQSPIVSVKIFSRSAPIWSRVTSTMSPPSTHGTRDDKISVTGGIDCYWQPCQFRKLSGKPVPKDHVDYPTGGIQAPDDHALGTMY